MTVVFGTASVAAALITGLVVGVRTNDGDFMLAAVIGAGVAAALVMALCVIVLLAQGYEFPGQEVLLRPGEFVLEKTFGEQER